MKMKMKHTARSLLLVWFAAVPAHAQITELKHVVVIFQENRTPDNLFQGLCGPPFGAATSCSTTPSATQYNIQTKNWLDKHSATGVTQPLPVALGNTYDLSHAHSAFIKMYDTGKMDGAGDISC